MGQKPEKMQELEKKVDRILFYLENDPGTEQEGLVSKVTRIDRELTELLTREKIYKAKAGVWGMIGAVVVTALYNLGKLIFTKFIL